MVTYYYSIHDIIRFSISGPNKRSLEYLDREYRFFRTDNEVQENDLEILLGKFNIKDEKRLSISNNQYQIGKNSSYFSESYKMLKYKIMIENLDNKNTKIFFSGPGLSFRILQLKFLIPLIRYKLSLKGYSLIKSSSVSNNSGAIIFPSWSGGGKTSFILYLTKKRFNYRSDTFSLISEDGFLYPFPNIVHLFYRNVKTCPFILEDLKIKDRVLFNLKNIIYIVSLKNINLSQFILQDDPILNIKSGLKMPIKFLFILSQSDNQEVFIEKAFDKDEIYKKILSIDIFETDQFNKFRLAYCYMNINSPLQDYWKMEEKIIRGALKSTNCYLLNLPKTSTQNEYKEILNIIDE